MQITFLIGNGFDINIGMKTQYPEFYKYYIKQPSSNIFVKKLKDNLLQDERMEYWKDLELALGRYTKDFEKPEYFELVLDDIREHLNNYIKIEEDKYIFTEEPTFCRSLVFPESFSLEVDGIDLQNFKSKWSRSTWNIDVVSFNYSTSLDKLLGYENTPKRLPNHNWGLEATLQSIKHIHGYTDRHFVLGVNDKEQIVNESFRSNFDILETLVKPECNRALKHLVDRECENLIGRFNLLCLFGLSFGDTDKKWWTLIGKRLLHPDCRLIIFSRGEKDLVPIHGQKIARIEREIKTDFLSKTSLDDTQQEIVRDKIFVVYNCEIFKAKLEKKEDGLVS